MKAIKAGCGGFQGGIEMFAIAVIEPGRIKVVEIPRPAPGSCDALVKNKVAYICNATDRKLVAGHSSGTGPDKYPLLLGYESIAIANTL